MRKTAKQIRFEFIGNKRKKKHSFFADTKLQVNQFKRKKVARSSISHCSFLNIFKSQNDQNLSSKETKKAMSFDLNCSVLFFN